MHSSPARHHVVLWLAMLAFGPPVDANAHRLSVLNPARLGRHSTLPVPLSGRRQAQTPTGSV